MTVPFEMRVLFCAWVLSIMVATATAVERYFMFAVEARKAKRVTVVGNLD